MNPTSSLYMNGPLQQLEDLIADSFPHALTNLTRKQNSKTDQMRNLTAPKHFHEGRPFILLITDKSQTESFFAPLFENDYNFTSAPSIADSVETIQRRCPDLILCDVSKHVDTAIKAVRHAQHFEIPFLLFSSASNKKRNLSLLGNGVTDFITTPFEPEELMAKVRNNLEICQTRKLLQNQLQSSSSALTELAEGISEKCQELSTLNRLKDEFLAVLSHELRNPINVISGFSEILLSDYELPESAQKAVDAIYRNAQIQNKLVADILDISRSNTGKLILDCQPVEFRTILKDVLPSIQNSAAKKGIQILVHTENCPTLVNGDSVRLTQVIWNLLSNAIKFTPPSGTVEVQLHCQNQWVELTVADSGLGIEPTFLPHIFREFYQQDSSITKNFGGLGLGLAIVRHIVEMHGGTAHAFSEGVGRGATFTVKLPALPN